MADYRLSERAEKDLSDIYDYSALNFGIYSADAYAAGLVHTFELLAQFPLMGGNLDEVMPGLKSFRFQSHMVCYTSEDDFLLIRAIPHIRQRLRPAMFE